MRITYRTQCAWLALNALSRASNPLCLEEVWDGAGPKAVCREVMESLAKTGWVRKRGTLYELAHTDYSLEGVRRLVEQHFNSDHPFSVMTSVVREVLEDIRTGENQMKWWKHISSAAEIKRLTKEVEKARGNPDIANRFSEELRSDIVRLANVEGVSAVAEALGFYASQIYTWRRQMPTPSKEVVKELKAKEWEECLADPEEEPEALQKFAVATPVQAKESSRKVLCSMTFHNGTRVDVYE